MKTVKIRLIFAMMLCVLLATAFLSVSLITAYHSHIESNAVSALDNKSALYAERVNSILTGAENDAKAIAEIAEKLYQSRVSGTNSDGGIDTYARLSSLMQVMMDSDTKIKAAYTLLIGDMKDNFRGIYILRRGYAGGYSDVSDELLYPNSKFLEIVMYYTTAGESAGTWRRTGYNPISGSTTISCLIPMYYGGKIVGITGVDITVTEFEDICSEVAGYESGYSFILDGTSIVVHPLYQSGTKLSDIDKSLVSVLVNAEGKQGTGGREYTHNGIRKLFSAVRLSNDMTLYSCVESDELYESTEQINKRAIAIAVIFCAVLVIIFSILLTSIMSPTNRDPLTGVNVRAAFIEAVKKKLAGEKDSPYAFIMLDLDRFKEINDRNGHEMGDKALRQVTTHLHHIFPSDSIIGRFGGDEFLVFVKCPRHDDAETFVRQFMELLSHGGEIYEKPLFCSVGIIYSDDYNTDIDSLMKCADDALYAAKNSGRNRYIFGKLEQIAGEESADEKESTDTADGGTGDTGAEK